MIYFIVHEKHTSIGVSAHRTNQNVLLGYKVLIDEMRAALVFGISQFKYNASVLALNTCLAT